MLNGDTRQPLAISSEPIHSSLAAILEKVVQMNRKYEYFFSQFETANDSSNKYDEIDTVPEECTHDITVHTSTVEYEIENRHDVCVDCPDPIAILINGAPQEDVIVDVSNVDDPVPQTKQVEVSSIVVVLNKQDQVIEFDDCDVRDLPIVCSYGLASPKIKRAENESVDTFYKIVGLTVIVIGGRSNPNVIYFLIYTLRTRWFLKSGRMLWIRGQEPKSGRRSETRSKESKAAYFQLYYIVWPFN
ncbi:hypothetical protein CASFOL_038353 [Castilleja foliolosa]|uniref:Uncharacterized protein n=1 Tax=Castilleja foliolosa TaxID=1961234 RepID=A0ABD3BMR9_9LAMI